MPPFLHSEPQVAPAVVGSPPFTVLELDGDNNVFRAVSGDPPGTPTAFTDNADGGAVFDGANNPVLSPDGTKIAYTLQNATTGFTELYVSTDTPGATPTLLLSDGSNWLMYPMWSPDSATIVYTHGIGGAFRGKVCSIPASGGAETVLYTPGAAFGAFRPAYNFDGSLIAFVLDRNIGAGDSIVVMNADGSGATSVATIKAYRFDGSQFGWANAANRIAYDDGATDCRVMNSDGTGNTLINTGGLAGVPVRCSKFCWLADDSAVIVTANAFGTWQVYSLDLGGAGSTLLSAVAHSANQQWMKQAFDYAGRLWMIEGASGTNQGKLSSILEDGTDYRVDVDLTAGAVGDFFYGGTGFEWQ